MRIKFKIYSFFVAALLTGLSWGTSGQENQVHIQVVKNSVPVTDTAFVLKEGISEESIHTMNDIMGEDSYKIILIKDDSRGGTYSLTSDHDDPCKKISVIT